MIIILIILVKNDSDRAIYIKSNKLKILSYIVDEDYEGKVNIEILQSDEGWFNVSINNIRV